MKLGKIVTDIMSKEPTGKAKPGKVTRADAREADMGEAGRKQVYHRTYDNGEDIRVDREKNPRHKANIEKYRAEETAKMAKESTFKGPGRGFDGPPAYIPKPPGTKRHQGEMTDAELDAELARTRANRKNHPSKDWGLNAHQELEYMSRQANKRKMTQSATAQAFKKHNETRK